MISHNVYFLELMKIIIYQGEDRNQAKHLSDMISRISRHLASQAQLQASFFLYCFSSALCTMHIFSNSFVQKPHKNFGADRFY